MNDKFDSTIQFLEKQLATLHIGRVSPAIMDDINVSVYDSVTPLNQLASITNQGAQSLVIQPWDTSIIKNIEKTLHEADQGFSPVVDGTTIRVVFPPMTEEKRKETVKVVKDRCEEAHVSIKKVREELMHELKTKKNDKEISEDDFFAEQKDIQKLVDDYNTIIKDLGIKKEKEILTI
ncbi:MAG: ribosome recycling factor [bacterium]|nr:ribosome recycling factor [bacterium]